MKINFLHNPLFQSLKRYLKLIHLNYSTCSSNEALEVWQRDGLVCGASVGPMPPKGSSFYIGFDPTAQSLHIGSLLGFSMARRLFDLGYMPVFLIGTATARIGDPSFRSTLRMRTAQSGLIDNNRSISAQVWTLASKFFPKESFKIVHNSSWINELSLIDFLEQIGSQVRLSSLLDRESVKQRLSSEGMSFSELTYQLLQAYDFYHLYKSHNVHIQIGGSDQWGNMIGGVSMIKRCLTHLSDSPVSLASDSINSDSEEKHFPIEPKIITFPLALDLKSGEKLGKSMGRCIYLDADLTSPFDFYQYFLRLPDDLALQWSKWLAPLIGVMKPECMNRKLLADLITRSIHGDSVVNDVSLATTQLYDKDLIFSNSNESNLVALEAALKASSQTHFKMSEIAQRRTKDINKEPDLNNLRIIDAICLCTNEKYSRRDLRRLANDGAVAINGQKISEAHLQSPASDQTFFVRIGKATNFMISP